MNIGNIDVILLMGGSFFIALNTIMRKIKNIKNIFFLRKVQKIEKKLIALVSYKDSLGSFINLFDLKISSLVTFRDKAFFDLAFPKKKFRNLHLADDIIYDSNFESTTFAKSRLEISTFIFSHVYENNNQQYQVLVRIIDKYIKKNKVKDFYFFDSEIDLVVLNLIIRVIDNTSMLRIVLYLDNIYSFLSKNSTCKFQIILFFYAAVLANIFSEISFYPITYSNKMEELVVNGFPNFLLMSISHLQLVKFDLSSLVDTLSNLTTFCCSNHINNANIHFVDFKKLWSESGVQ